MSLLKKYVSWFIGNLFIKNYNDDSIKNNNDASMSFLKKGICFLLTGCVSGLAFGSIGVTPLWLDMSTGTDVSRFYDITVANNDNQKVYVGASVYKLAGFTAHADANWQPVNLQNIENAGLLLSWQKTMLLPKEQKFLRIVNLVNKISTDQVFMILVRPVVPDFVKASQIPIGHLTGQLQLIFGYRVKVVIRPQKLDPKWLEKDNKNSFILQNTGNTTLYFSNVKLCDMSIPDACQVIENKHLFPAQKWLIPNAGATKLEAKISAPNFVKQVQWTSN